MKIDFGDVFGSGLGLLVKQVVLVILAVWTGSSIAAFSYVAGRLARAPSLFEPSDLGDLARGPEFLLSVWLLPNILFFAVMGCRLIVYSESAGYRSWAVLIAGEALFAMGAVNNRVHGWVGLPVAWICCLGLAATIWAGLWFLHHRQLARWAHEVMAIKAENSARRLEMKEEYGTDSAGVDEVGPP